MHFYDLIANRYSMRKYLPNAVPEDALLRMLEAARIAPSAANRQPWRFYVVRDEATRRALFPLERQQWIAEAPVVIVVCSRPAEAWVRKVDGKNHADVDMAIAMEHIVLAATEEGLGSCWICAFDPEVFRRVLELPDDMEPVAATPIGFATGSPAPRDRKSLDEIVIWR